MDTKKEKKNLLVFGYGLAVIISFFVWRHSVKHGGIGPVSTGFLIIAGIIFLVTLIDYRKLRSFYALWMKGAHFIGQVVSTVALSFLFYFVFGIVGIVLRLIGRDLLDRKIDKARASYWSAREHREYIKDSYRNQF